MNFLQCINLIALESITVYWKIISLVSLICSSHIPYSCFSQTKQNNIKDLIWVAQKNSSVWAVVHVVASVVSACKSNTCGVIQRGWVSPLWAGSPSRKVCGISSGNARSIILSFFHWSIIAKDMTWPGTPALFCFLLLWPLFPSLSHWWLRV